MVSFGYEFSRDGGRKAHTSKAGSGHASGVSIKPGGEFVVATRNRHEMALRGLRAIKGKKITADALNDGANSEEGVSRRDPSLRESSP